MVHWHLMRLTWAAIVIGSASLPRNANASPLSQRGSSVSSAQAPSVSVSVEGVTYENKGLVAFGLIPSDFVDSTGDTMGGIGSAMAIKFGTWSSRGDTFIGTLLMHPDRGLNVNSTINYQARQQEIDFVLTPYYGSANLSFAAAQETLKLKYTKTTLQVERLDKKTSGLDPAAVRAATLGFPLLALADPQIPIVSKVDNRLVLDVEGVIANSDGSFWISDEYGPYIYKFSESGHLIQTIQPPKAIQPRDAKGNLNFTANTDPTTGRVGNQGFEGLTVDPSTGTVYAMLQSATVQDGGSDSTTSRFTRLLAYDVNNPILEPRLIGEYVVPLPVSSKGKTRASSEVHFVSPGIFFSLSRDANGRGSDDNSSSYKQADLFSIKKATDIHGTKFDDPANPIAINGVLDTSIVPAEYVPFVDYLDPVQLARFGLHNGSPDDPTLLDAKWESLVLTPVEDPRFPDDYFLFTASDNDFLTTHGISLGVPFNGGIDVDNQFLVFRLTLPSIPRGSLQKAIGAL